MLTLIITLVPLKKLITQIRFCFPARLVDIVDSVVAYKNSADPDQIVSLEASCSGFTLFCKEVISGFSRPKVKFHIA